MVVGATTQPTRKLIEIPTHTAVGSLVGGDGTGQHALQ